MATTLRAQTTTNAPAQSTAPAADYDQIILHGNMQLKAGDFASAGRDAIKALALDGNRFEAYALESLVSFKEGQTTEAKAFMDLALAKVPASKKPQLEALAATIESVGSPAAVPSTGVSAVTPSQPAEADQLHGDDRLEYETLLAMLSDADKASDLDSRHRILADFMGRSDEFLKNHPGLVHLWVARAAAAIELDRFQDAWEAGERLVALGQEESNDPAIRNVLVKLNERGWLNNKKLAGYGRNDWVIGIWKVSCGILGGPTYSRGEEEFRSSGHMIEGYEIGNNDEINAQPELRGMFQPSGEISWECYYSTGWEPVVSFKTSNDRLHMMILIPPPKSISNEDPTAFSFTKVNDSQNPSDDESEDAIKPQEGNYYSIAPGSNPPLQSQLPHDGAGGEVAMTGTLVCGKCKLHITKFCQNVLEVPNEGATMEYFLAQNQVSKDFHSNICQTDGEHVTVTGTIKEMNGKEVLTATSIEPMK